MKKPTGADMIARERRRQISKEGWSRDHDKRCHGDDQLVEAAICYAGAFSDEAEEPHGWPDGWVWNPKDRLSNLVRAGALIAAEIDRLMADDNPRKRATGGKRRQR